MSQKATEKEISAALLMAITNDLKKNGENTEASSLFKPKILCPIDRIKEKKNFPKILCAIDRIKEKMNFPDIDSIYDYLSRTEASNIDKVSIQLILNELVQENVLVNKKTSVGDSFRRINTPPNLVNL